MESKAVPPVAALADACTLHSSPGVCQRVAKSYSLTVCLRPHPPLSYRNISMTVLQTIYWQPTPP